MPTKDRFAPDHSLPPVLADEPEQQGTGKPRDRAVMWSRVLKASILVATFGVVVLGLTFFADVTASLVDKSALQPGTDQSTPTIQATADAAEALQPTPNDAATSDDEYYEPFVRAIAVLLDQGAAAGELKKGLDPEDVLMQLSVLWRIDPEHGGEARAARILGLIIDGLRAK